MRSRCLLPWARVAFAPLALWLASQAWAHDSWFVPLPPTERGERVLALGTGDRFPVLETPLSIEHVATSGCHGAGQARPVALRWLADRPSALLMRTTRPLPGGAALSCWAQLLPQDIEIDDTTVEVYLNEVNAGEAVRARWQELRARGVRWRERYTKHARIEIGTETAPAGSPAAAAPGDAPALGLDVRLESPLPLRAGDTLRVQVLRDGQPLAGQPVELRSDLSPIGLWRQTDADGRVSIPVPLAARWLLRGVDLRPSATRADAWESRFVTLAFEVLPRR
jgi:hypothetical protein